MGVLDAFSSASSALDTSSAPIDIEASPPPPSSPPADLTPPVDASPPRPRGKPMQSPSNLSGPRTRRSLVLPPVSPIQKPSSPVESVLADLSDVVRVDSDGEAASSAGSDDSLLLGSTGTQGDVGKSALDETLETI